MKINIILLTTLYSLLMYACTPVNEAQISDMVSTGIAQTVEATKHINPTQNANGYSRRNTDS